MFIELNEMPKIQKPTNFRIAKIETKKFDDQRKTLGSATITGQ
jgi:hypothetical protein